MHLHYPHYDTQPESFSTKLQKFFSPPRSNSKTKNRDWFSLFYVTTNAFVLMSVFIHWAVIVPKYNSTHPGERPGRGTDKSPGQIPGEVPGNTPGKDPINRPGNPGRQIYSSERISIDFERNRGRDLWLWPLYRVLLPCQVWYQRLHCCCRGLLPQQ